MPADSGLATWVHPKQIKQNRTNSVEAYTWDAEGCLASVSFQGGSNDGYTVEYDYDEQGTLVWRKIDDGQGNTD